MTRTAIFRTAMIGGLLLGCGGTTKAPSGTGPEANARNAIAERFKECGQLAFAKQWEPLGGCFTADAVAEISGVQQFHGPDEIVHELFEPFITAFPDAQVMPVLLLVNGKNLVGVMAFHGTNTGSLMGMPPTGKPGGFLGMRTVTFNDAGTQMTYDLHVADFGTLLGQLGMSPAPHRPVPHIDAPPTTVVATGSDTEKANVAVVEKMCAVFNKHDAAGVADLFADDGVMSDQTAPDDLRGKAAIKGLLAELFAAFPDMNGTCSAWAAGDYVVNQVEWTATNDGDFPSAGMKATHRKASIHDSEVYQLSGGKIVKYWRFSNGIALATQLGLVPPPAGK